MLRLISYTLVFIFGFAACAVVVNRLPPYHGAPATPPGASLAAYRPPVPLLPGSRYSVADAVQRVEPAVVSIDTIGHTPVRENWEELWLRRWFGRPPPHRED